MSYQYDTDSQEQPTAQEESQFWAQQLARYLAPYQERLDAYLDRRGVGNLITTGAAIVERRQELTTSPLGRGILRPTEGGGGTPPPPRALNQPGCERRRAEK